MATNRDDSLKYSSITIQECYDLLDTHPNTGLSLDQVRIRQQRYGKNELDQDERESLVKKFLEQFQDPLILLLLASALISLIIGQVSDAVSILLTIIIVLTGSEYLM
jgi:Ca2+-transporting ATPase